MAEYILKILKTQLMIVFSWGFNTPIAIVNGLRFKVSGFKFKGIVEVVYNEATDLFDVHFLKRGKVVESIKDVYIESLIDVIDYKVERVVNYNERVKNEYYNV